MYIVFYHDEDFDGKCSAAIARKFFGEKGIPIVLKAHNYEKEIDDSGFTEKDTIFFLDVTANPYAKIPDLAEKYDVTVIDHHRSFKKFFDENSLEGKFKYYYDENKSGCELTWEYFYGAQPMPDIVS